MHQIDQCSIHTTLTLSANDLESLMLVYTPCIGSFNVSVYLMLSAFSKESNQFFSIRKLTDFLNCSVDELEQGIKKCEQFKLISTFYQSKSNSDAYVFSLKEPLSIICFMQHDVFGRYLLKVMDSSYLQQLKDNYTSIDLKDYQNISEGFDSASLSYWQESKEKEFKSNKQPLNKELMDTLSFDTPLFLQTTPMLLFPKQARNKENIATIEYLGSLYGIDVVTMKGFVGKCTKVNQTSLNTEKLESLIVGYVNQHKTSKTSDYKQDSYTFFSSKQNGKALGVRDKKTIAFLYENYSFNQEVLNMLIEYVLTRFKGSFTKGLVQQIADSWFRANINSISDVKKHLQKQQATTTTIDSPSYMQDKVTKKASKEDEEKRVQLLERLKQGEKK